VRSPRTRSQSSCQGGGVPKLRTRHRTCCTRPVEVSIHRSRTTRTPLRVVRIPRRGRPRLLGVPHPYTARRSPRTLPGYDPRSTRTPPEAATRADYRRPTCSDWFDTPPPCFPPFFLRLSICVCSGRGSGRLRCNDLSKLLPGTDALWYNLPVLWLYPFNAASFGNRCTLSTFPR